jgi:hypothetical protein
MVCVVPDTEQTALITILTQQFFLKLVATGKAEHGSGLGRWQWVVKRSFAWLNQFRRLLFRYEKRANIREAFLAFDCILICRNFFAR